LLYLPHYLKLAPADFHSELLSALENHGETFLEIIGFRGSAKSTYASLALTLWAALEYPEYYPFIIPVADTSLQAKMNIANIQHELESNELIQNDYGDVRKKGEWQKEDMVLSNGVRILARSRGQKVRGLRHRQFRPSIVIVDDPEETDWIRT